MKVIFAGTPEFARAALVALHAAGHEMALVLTQPDRPAGRGMKLQASPVKQWAVAHHTPVAQPRSLRLDGKYPDDARAARTAIHSAQADVMVVAAYGLILPQWVLDMPPLGCLNIHASLLPRWRGAAPIHRAIEAGDVETGITIMQMDAGLDTGNMLLVKKQVIAAGDTTPSLHDKLAAMGGQMIVDALGMAGSHSLIHTPQPANGITYARKVDKLEASIDWAQNAAAIQRRIRAFNPFPGTSCVLNGDVIKVLDAHVSGAVNAGNISAGSIFDAQDQGIDVVTGNGLLRITRLQKAGGKPLAVADFLRGFPVTPGMAFATLPITALP